MHHLSQAHNLQLQRNQAASLACTTSVLIRVKTGRVWITAYGVLDDHWLAAGESLRLPPSQHIVVQAEDRFTSIDLSPIANAQPEPQMSIWATISQLLRRPQFGA